jgi:hypothetical protein
VTVSVSGVAAACVVVVEAALGACAGEARAFAEPDLCRDARARVASWRKELPPASVSLPEVLARFAVMLACVLPGKACAAIAVNAPVSVTLPVSSQRLQRVRRFRAASRDRLEGEEVMHSYSTPLPFTH